MTGKAPTEFLYIRSGRYFAQVAHGLREMASEELLELGAEKTGLARAGVHFHADREAAYRIVRESRLVTRVIAPLIIFDCHSDKYLHRTAKKMEWERLLDPTMTFRIAANVGQSRIKHSLYAAQVTKDAIVDRFREATGERPSVDTKTADLTLNLHIANDRATIGVDLGGESLHRRGYRTEGGVAPMQETVAAAVIRFSGWDGERPLVDPMCGSGTLLAEALMRVGRIPAGFLRPTWGLERLPDFDAATWRKVREAGDAGRRDVASGTISGSDRAKEAIARSRANLAALPGGDAIVLRRRAFQDLDPLDGVTIVSNPPYGLRLGNPEKTAALMKEFGDFLKQKCRGSSAWLFFGDRELIKSVGLKAARKIPLRAGGLDGRLVKYEMW